MTGKETLIFIEENDKRNAGISANNFAKEDTRNRAYYNHLGALLAKKYLASENVNVLNTYNIHSIQKILEEVDISDIMLDNIHIDVRVVFNENFIFVPKSHFNYEILPDIYMVLLMSNDKKSVKFLGFFEPKLINKNNQNEDYYFIEKEKLTSPENLKDFVSNFKGNTAMKLSESEIDESDMLILSLIDYDINAKEKKQLLKTLVKSAQLRDRFIEFENFELLAYKAQQDPEITKPYAKAQDNTLDFAAEATAEALDKFNQESSSINTLDDLSDLVEESAETTAGIEAAETAAGFDSLSDFSELEDLTVGDMSELSELAQNSAPETNESDIDVIAESTAEQNETSDDAIMMNLESMQSAAASNGELENSISDIEEVSAPVDFDEFETVNESLHNEEIQAETISLEDIEIPETDTLNASESAEQIQPETVDLEEIETIAAETPMEVQEVETLSFDEIDEPAKDSEPEDSAENIVTEETLDLEEIGLSADLEDISMDEPALELENIEENVKDENLVEDNSNISDSQGLEDAAEETFAAEPEMLMEEGLSEELSFDEDLTLEESENEESLEANAELETFNSDEDLRKEVNKFEEVLQPRDDLASMDSLMPLETELNAVQETPTASISDEDKELDAMLGMEEFNMSGAGAESGELLQEEPNNGLMDFDAISDEKSAVENTAQIETSNSQDSEDININDLKEISSDIEELTPEDSVHGMETGELIAEIDELMEEEGDENSTPEQSEGNDDKLEMLFNSAETSSEEDGIAEEFDTNNEEFNEQTAALPEKGKKAVLIAAALGLLLLAGTGAGLFLKNKAGSSDVLSQNPIENDTANLPSPEPETPNTPDNTDLMTGNAGTNPTPAATPAPVQTPAPAPAQKPAAKAEKPAAKAEKPAAKPAQATSQPAKPATTAIPYVSVKSLTWEVPDYLSYSDKVKKYLQTAGKSIKLSLSSDLLLATEYAYSNQVRVELKLKNDGTVENVQITKSSGSNQINDIVLRTVKETLKVVKPAPGEIPTPNFKLGLIINL